MDSENMYFWADASMVNVLRVNASGIVSFLEPDHVDYQSAVETKPKSAQVLEVYNKEAVVLPERVRTIRDSLLVATDWTANSDVTMSDEMRTYRQALRDVPAQAGFPDDVTWPVKPS